MNSYNPNDILRASLQLMETMFIMENSKSVDTVIGRTALYNDLIRFLKERCSANRYLSDVQTGLDEYKSLYYDRIPTDLSLLILTQPHLRIHSEFICVSIYNSFGKMFEDFINVTKTLTRESAKVKRRGSILKLLYETRMEIQAQCSDAKSYNKIMDTINKIEEIIKSNSDFNNINLVKQA